MKPFIFNNWHAWQGTKKFMLSDELNKTLREFDNVDACINWLYIMDDGINKLKEVARALHKHKKENK